MNDSHSNKVAHRRLQTTVGTGTFVILWCKISQKYSYISPMWSQAQYLYGLWFRQMFLQNCDLFLQISAYDLVRESFHYTVIRPLCRVN